MNMITITKENINEYLGRKYDDIKKINWVAGDLIKEVIDNFPNMCLLDCSNNHLTTLDALSDCVNLEDLVCYENDITTLDGLKNCVNLRELDCSDNQLTTLNGLKNCVNLQKLFCHDNHLTTLDELINCVNLQELDCSVNEIVTLDGLINCINLQNLICAFNQIPTLNVLIYLRNLNNLFYFDNPLEIQNVQIERLLERINSNKKSSIYDDGQNVHDITIQKSVCNSIQNLLKDPKPIFSINDILNSSLKKNTIEAIIEYCNDKSTHSIHLITYEELFIYVWGRIKKIEI